MSPHGIPALRNRHFKECVTSGEISSYLSSSTSMCTSTKDAFKGLGGCFDLICLATTSLLLANFTRKLDSPVQSNKLFAPTRKLSKDLLAIIGLPGLLKIEARVGAGKTIPLSA